MSSGSPAHDGGGRPSARHSYRDEATSGPDPYGPGPRSDPHDDPAGQRGVPYGPDISWPHGFQQIDPESQRLLESGYGPGGYGRGPYDTGGPGYQQPAMDDFGYGDPGYSDPAYNGPRSAYTGPQPPGGNRGSGTPGSGGYPGRHALGARGPGYAEPGYQQYADPLGGSDQVYPVTGAQEALPATGPQPTAESWAVRDAGPPGTGTHAYPEQWYGNPRMDDALAGGPRHDDPPAADPRLAGMRYDQLRYEDASFGGPGYDEPLDDEAWYEELRRSGPAYPQRPGDQFGSDQRPPDPQRRPDPRVFGYGQQPGYGQSGYGQPGYSPTHEQSYGYGQGWDDRGGPGPRMSAGPEMGSGSWPAAMSGPGDARQPGPGYPEDLTLQGADYLGAPTAQVGVLTPPGTPRLDDPADASELLVDPGSGRLLARPVRPGHGLDGPEITSSWPAQPSAEELESFEEFWREDDKDGGYPGLFPPDDAGLDAARDSGGRGRGAGRRRGRSNDHRLWLALGGVVVIAAAAIFGIVKYEFPKSTSGPAHTMATPAKIGSYVRTVDLERQTNVAELRSEVIKMSGGKATGVVSAVYESGDSAAGNNEQIIMLIEGHLADAAPAASIASFTQKFPGATVVNAGSLGGKAACAEEGAGTSDPKSLCVWFDNDSFGEIVSPTMNARSLADVMLTVRPSVELVAK